jgi:glycosyltransferase involved in cell wall biosynthesis
VGGAQLHSRELIQRLSSHHGVEVVSQFTSDKDTVVQSIVNARPSEYGDGDIRVRRIGPVGLWADVLKLLSRWYGRFRPVNPVFAFLLNLAIAPQLAEIVRQFRPDVIHTVHIGLIYSSETARRVARRFRIPFVWTPLPHIEGKSGWRGPRFRRLYRTSDAVIAMTRREKTWLEQQGASAERVHVVPVGPLIEPQYDAQAFRQAHGLGQAPMVLFLGQKLPYKGYQQVVEAAPLVWAEVPEARFVLVGPRTAESERLFATLTDPRIVELPPVEPEEKSSALAACDVFCMPSMQESLGVVYLEAWCFRKPVIAASIHIAQEVVEEGQDGFLVEQKPEAIAQAILALLQDRSLAHRMGEAGYRKVCEHYVWEELVIKMERVYATLLEK